MTDTTETLLATMEQIDAIETVLAINNLVLAGLVTDPQVLFENIEVTNKLLTAQLLGMRMLMDPEFNATAHTLLDRLSKD